MSHDAQATLIVGRYGLYFELNFGEEHGVAILTCDDWGKWKLDSDDMNPLSDVTRKIEVFQARSLEEIRKRIERVPKVQE